MATTNENNRNTTPTEDQLQSNDKITFQTNPAGDSVNNFQSKEVLQTSRADFDKKTGIKSPVIELKNVCMSFEKTDVLKNVQLKIFQQESFVVIGPSGHGKSVLLKLMAGLLQPTEGQVFIEGMDLKTITHGQRRQLTQKMGMLFQKNALFDSMSVSENVAFPMRATTNWTESEIIEKVNYYLEAVGILHAKELYPDEISGGMQKRLGIARALALQPEIIFYDDPTAGLDPITSRMIVKLILELKEKNKSTVVAITNDMNRAYQMADQIGMLVQSELIITGNVEQTKHHTDSRVQQFIHGSLQGSLTSLE